MTENYTESLATSQHTTLNNQQNEQLSDQLPLEIYLSDHYEFRFNCISNKTEVRLRAHEDWQHLDTRMLNSILVAARKALPEERELKTQLTSIIYSCATPVWNPVTDWLGSLPAWDGRNRVTHLFGLIPAITAEQLYWLSVWLRSTVAHWLQMDTLHGNECVPTLIGEQGCGKSTFCQRLLPTHLREYYLDHVNLSNKFDKEMALTNNLIVNLDELDQIKPHQQAELKQMLSKVCVNGRPIYGREQSDRLRYASFVATTNNRHPLRDRTGSRRYICIEVPRGQEIDNTVEIEYEQLYAQLLAELALVGDPVTHALKSLPGKQPQRFWFTTEETRSIQRANVRYQNTLDMETMVETCFRQPEDSEFVSPLSSHEMLTIISNAYPAVQENESTRVRLGIALQHLGYQRDDGHLQRSYYAVPLQVA
ncbi:MAG: helicase [Bacteroidaceae bacterium]|nr:helicase [Bacteroidaceae bacterium]